MINIKIIDRKGINSMNNNNFEELDQFLSSYLSENSPKVTLDPNTELSILGLDSLMMLRLLNFLEKTYKMKIHDEQIDSENFKSISSIKNLIANHKKGQN